MSAKYFKSLLLKSSRLQQEIEVEQHRRRPDPFRLLKLKKLRLLIADRLQAVFRADVTTLRPISIQSSYQKRR